MTNGMNTDAANSQCSIFFYIEIANALFGLIRSTSNLADAVSACYDDVKLFI